MKTNYTNRFVKLKADFLPSPGTYTDNPVGLGSDSPLTHTPLIGEDFFFVREVLESSLFSS